MLGKPSRRLVERKGKARDKNERRTTSFRHFSEGASCRGSQLLRLGLSERRTAPAATRGPPATMQQQKKKQKREADVHPRATESTGLTVNWCHIIADNVLRLSRCAYFTGHKTLVGSTGEGAPWYSELVH